MAEFKLGRIRFVWQGDWAPATTYVVDDVVRVGGNSYICVINHTSSSLFEPDLNEIPTYWNLVAQGLEWKGDWTTSTYYNIGDQVKYGGVVYICTDAHTSAATDTLGLEADQAKWDALAETLYWTEDWATSTRYRVNDLVAYGGITYLCNTSHTSAATAALGLEADQSKWDVFNQGFVYLGVYTDAVRYRVNDIVKYGAGTWICTTAHTSTSTFDLTKWSTFVEGLQFEDSWSSSSVYQEGDVVTYGGYSYIAKQNHSNQNPSTETAYWDVYTTGYNFSGDWNSSTSYKVGDVVRVGGYTYVAVLDNSNQTPPNGTYWSRLNQGLRWADNSQTYTNVSATTLTGSGISATFDVVRSKTIYTVSINNGGSGFDTSDTLRILGSSVGGISPANDILLTVSGTSSGVITGVNVVGNSSTWKDSTAYVAGDLVFWGASTYICIEAHVSGSGNRPDNDSTATYWNLFAAGSESSVLTVTGDTYYYGPTGPTRLPIGADGTVLRSRNGYPEWAYYGVINNLVYVAPTGTNSTESGWGQTIDKPWASVRFACEQIENGYRNKNATALLTKNKQFIMKEVTNWILYTYSVSITASSNATNEFTCNSTANLSVNMPIEFDGTVGGVTAGTKYFVASIVDSTHFTIKATLTGVTSTLTTQTANMTGVLSYDHTYCERDTGILVEALLYDLSHGGNEESTKAARAYYTTAGYDFITSNFGQQLTQTVAAYNFMKDLVANVINGTATSATYQGLNNVASGDRVEPTLDSTLVAEADTDIQAQALISIVTDGIEAGVASAIPTAIYSNTTISVKTGTYYEVLPIVLPKNTAVVGDELRSSVISPQPAIANLVNDKPKTISALERIKSLAPSLLANSTIVPSSGNDATQEFVYLTSESIAATSVIENTDTIKTILGSGLTAVPAFVMPQPDDFDVGYKNAVLQLQANADFIKAEITAWIAVQVAGPTAPFSGSFTYDSAACARDVGYILDAICYDLTYGGNNATLEAARAYFSEGAAVYGSGEKEETLAAYAYLKSIIGDVIQETAVTPSAGNTETQDTTGTAGSSNAATFAENRVQDIYDALDVDGDTNDVGYPAVSDASKSWVNTKLTSAYTTVQAAKTTIQADAIAWVNTYFPDLVYDEALCSRDVGLIVDALCWDMVFKSNYRSVKAGMAYYRGLTSTGVVTADQLPQTIGIVNFIREAVLRVTGGTDMLSSNVSLMADILANGLTSVPSFVFTTPTGGSSNGYDSGYFNAARLILANKAFLKAEVTAWINVQIAGPIAPFSGFSYDATTCERDVGYIVDALYYDLTYGGNIATQIAARSYYSNGVLVEVGEEDQAKALWAYVKTIIDNIATGSAITPSSGNVVSQVTSGTAGSAGAGVFAQARIQEIYDTIDTGVEPTLVAPGTSWVHTDLTTINSAIVAAKAQIQAAAVDWVNHAYPNLIYDIDLCSRDVGYIIDALRYDMMFESNFLSSWNAMSYHRGLTSTGVVLDEQLQPSLGIIGYVGSALKELSLGKSGITGNTQAISRIERSANTIYDVINNGLTSVPSEIITDPTDLDADFENARTQILNNYAFIKADVSKYIENNYPAVWSALGATGQAACQRDVGYILDAIRYDLTYGGNTQTVVTGRAYYTGLDLTFDTTELTATLAAYAHMKSIIDDVAQRLSVTPQSGNVTAQDLSGTGGDATAAAFAQARIDDVIYWINNGEDPTLISPSTTWVDAGLVAGFNEIQTRKAEIQSDGLAYVRKFFQSLTFDEALCSRDIGYMVDAIGYDIMFNSNFASVIVGKSYHRAISSTQTVLTSQKDASLGLIKFLKYKLKGLVSGGAVSQVGALVSDIVGTINGGAVPRFLWPDYTGVDSQDFAAAKLIWENKEFIAEETLQYIYDNYPAIEYSRTACARDVGYIVDALRYDMTYGGNFASKQAGIAYYSRLTSALQIDSADKAATLAAYGNLKTIVQDIANGGLSAYTALQTRVSYISGPVGYAGDANAATRVGALTDIITNIIDNGLTTGVPTITVTTISGTNTLATGSAHGLAVGDEFIPQSTANGLTSGTTYYVKSVPLSTTFTLAATYDGTEITSLTNGTGLSIVAEYTDLPGTSWVASSVIAQNTLLSSNKATIQTNIINWINTNYPNLDYNSTTCSRDVGYIIDALRYDLMMGSNFRSVKAGMSYYQAQASAVVGDQKRATLQAFRQMKAEVVDVLNDATSIATVKKLMLTIINILDKGVGETPDVNGTMSYMNNEGIVHAAEILRANKTFLENESTAWIRSQFGGTVTSTNATGNVVTTSTSHNLSIGDPVVFTSDIINTLIEEVSSTGNLVTVRTTENVVPNMEFTITGTGLGSLTAGTYYVKTVESATTLTLSTTAGGVVLNPGNATGLASVIIGSVWGGPTANVQYYVYSIPTTTTFTVAETADATSALTLTSKTGVMTVAYSFDETACKRDMAAYIDAMVYDLTWPGNYKSTRAAVLYNNAVQGSELSDMFQVSNASGLRNCTLRGLEGDLSDENDYGTKRPTGGAYVALNPGFGPNDSKVWVQTRSHYSQNVTMFGYGCTGAKIDSALHAGGNKSMVKNDFTTILSDGIGVWCTGADSLTELVSVFNYYGYAGYLAELGGRIRATNGNSSYGTYGVIAEGVDSKEVPIYGYLDNRGAQAQITNTVTDGVMEILRFEFGNAGSNYSNTTHTINGAGYNADAIGDEFRDGATFETRIIDLDNGDGVGGTSYVTAANAAQTGDIASITIAATDQALSAAYVGMRIQITAGSGVGQYANILQYNTGSKIAKVYKDSFTSLTATATADTGDWVTVSSNATLYVNMPVYFTGTTFGGVTASTLYYVKALNGSTQFSISLTEGGTTENLSTASGTMTVLAAGWDHVVPGTAIENVLDLTTTYIIEPRISYTAPGYTATARTLSATATWNDIAFGDNKYVAIANGSTNTAYSTNGTTWANAGALTNSNMIDVVYGGGFGAVATIIVGGIGGRGAVLEAVLGVPNTTGAATEDQVASVTIVDGGDGYDTPPVIVFTPVSGGTGAVATCTVLNGAIATITVTVPGSGYNVAPTVSAATDRVTDIVVNSWGRDYFSDPQVTIDDPFTGSAWSSGGSVTDGDIIYYTNTTVTPNRKNWYEVTVTGTLTTTGPTHTSGTTTNGTASLLYIGTTAVATPTRTNNGVSSLAINYSGQGYTTTPAITILDTGARYVAVDASGNNCYTTRAGIAGTSAWTAGTAMGGTPTIAGVAYGNGVYVAVGGTASAYSSATGSLWTTRTIPTLGSGTYSALAYGNETFVAITTGNVETAISSNGNSWSAGGNLPTSSTWNSIAYGNGRFVAIASGTRNVAVSTDKGTTWVLSANQLPSSATWTRVAYGQGLFFAISSGGTTAATSPDGITWTLRAMPSSSNWKAIEFGSIGSRPLWVAASNTSGTVAASIRTGAQALGRVKVSSGVVTEVRMVEPGSGYPYGTVSATTASSDLITVDNTVNLVDGQPVEFYGTSAGGLVEEQTYYVIGSTITSTQFKVSSTQYSATAVSLDDASISGMTYRAGPIFTVTDPNKVKEAAFRVRLGDGALGNPSFTDRGADNTTATSETSGDGYSDLFQVSTFVNVYGLSEEPSAGANVEFASIPGNYYKLVTVTNYVEDQNNLGTYKATFQLNPSLTTLNAPRHGDLITTRIKYSQVRLTGHDYLYIGTGNQTRTNYPNVDITLAVQANQELFTNGGRVFFTSTDQDGNFNVGDLFGVQQATGTATLNASAFNLSGLNSLQLGSVELGIGSAIITQFSTDPFFTADSDSVVPTQRAIRAYITAQIGGGQSSLNVNTLTSGVVYIAGNSISTTTGEGINVTSKMNFTGGIDGAPVALAFFMQR